MKAARKPFRRRPTPKRSHLAPSQLLLLVEGSKTCNRIPPLNRHHVSESCSKNEESHSCTVRSGVLVQDQDLILWSPWWGKGPPSAPQPSPLNLASYFRLIRFFGGAPCALDFWQDAPCCWHSFGAWWREGVHEHGGGALFWAILVEGITTFDMERFPPTFCWR